MLIKAYNLYGELYRHFAGEIIENNEENIVVDLPKSTEIWTYGELFKGEYHCIMTFWRSRHLNLMEFRKQRDDPAPAILYVNISSYPTITANEIAYTDYILDVVSKQNASPEIHDLDEFEEYIRTVNPSQDFIDACLAYCEEAKTLINERRKRYQHHVTFA